MDFSLSATTVTAPDSTLGRPSGTAARQLLEDPDGLGDGQKRRSPISARGSFSRNRPSSTAAGPARPARILHSGRHDERSVRTRLSLFLERQRTRHIVFLAGEAIVVPITGLAALLPGPNVIFYFLAILMIIQWQALRGITRILHRDHELVADPPGRVGRAVEARDEARYPEILDRLEKVHGLLPPARSSRK